MQPNKDAQYKSPYAPSPLSQPPNASQEGSASVPSQFGGSPGASNLSRQSLQKRKLRTKSKSGLGAQFLNEFEDDLPSGLSDSLPSFDGVHAGASEDLDDNDGDDNDGAESEQSDSDSDFLDGSDILSR